jgi:hypothetical protein
MTVVALRQAVARPPFRLGLAFAVLVLGAAFAGAAVVYYGHRYAYRQGCPSDDFLTCSPRVGYYVPGWVIPTALGICLLGVALAAGVLVTAGRTLSWPPSRGRLVASVLFFGVGLGGAAILRFHGQFESCPFRYAGGAVCSGPVHPGWFHGLVQVSQPALVLGPAALAVGFLGAAGAALVLLTNRWRLTTALLILGAGILGAAILQAVGYPSGYVNCAFPAHGVGPGRPDCLHVAGHPWVDPVSLALCVVGVAGAAGLLLMHRRRRTPA